MICDAFAIPPGLLPGIFTNASQVVVDVWPIAALAAGVALGLGVAGWLIESLKQNKE